MAAVKGLPSLTLVCDGHRAQADSSLQQGGNQSLIKALTQTAKVVCRNIACLADGDHHAVYEGRGAHRDVYRIGADRIMKLCDNMKENKQLHNRREVEALKATAHLSSTPTLFFHGSCDIQTRQFRGSSNSVTLRVDCVIMSYSGPSMDKLMHREFGLPYDHFVANFFVSAYRDLSILCIDGRSTMVAYSDLHTANICTKADPTTHAPGTSVSCVICDAEGVACTQWDRSTFNGCCDSMLADFELQCARARDKSWNFMAVLIRANLSHFFRSNGQDDMVVLRNRCMGKFQLFWDQVCSSAPRRSKRDVLMPSTMPPALSNLDPSQHYAFESVTGNQHTTGQAVITAPSPSQPYAPVVLEPWRPTLDASAWSAAATEPAPPQSVEPWRPTVTVDLLQHDLAAVSPSSWLGEEPSLACEVHQSVSAPPLDSPSACFGQLPDVGLAQLFCGHTLASRVISCDTCQKYDAMILEEEKRHQVYSGAQHQHLTVSGLSQQEQPAMRADSSYPSSGQVQPAARSDSSVAIAVSQSSQHYATASSGQLRPAIESEVVVPLVASAYAASSSYKPSSLSDDGVEHLDCGHVITSPQDEQAVAAETSFASRSAEPIVTDLWAGYVPISIAPPVGDSRLYASPLEAVAREEMQRQRFGKYRGVGHFQDDREGRVCWDDRVASNNFPRPPGMSRQQTDDVARLCKLMYIGLHNVLARIPLNQKGKKQRRVASESEFMKHGMVKRVFTFINSGDRYTENQWCHPRVVYEAAQTEFSILIGSDRETRIPNLQFIDDYERDFLASMITRAFISNGCLYGRSQGFLPGSVTLASSSNQPSN